MTFWQQPFSYVYAHNWLEEGQVLIDENISKTIHKIVEATKNVTLSIYGHGLSTLAFDNSKGKKKKKKKSRLKVERNALQVVRIVNGASIDS